MKAIKFPQHNHLIISAGPNVIPLPVYTDGHTCVSEWELSDEEIAELVKTRKIQLIVRTSPKNHPDVAVYAGNVIPPTIF